LSVLELNAKHPPLDKKEVRQAIAYAIDRKVILRDCHVWLWPAGHRPAQQPLQDRWVLYRRCAHYDVPDRLEIATSCSTARACARREWHALRHSSRSQFIRREWLRQADI